MSLVDAVYAKLKERGRDREASMTETNKKKIGKQELILLAAILAVAAALFAWNRFRHSEPAVLVEVTVNGKVVEMFNLNEDTDYVIESNEHGIPGTNHLIIKDGEAWISEASCPDKVCVYQGKVSHEGEMIVCLPNLVIVRIMGEQTQ